jgi:hypothetical protein
LFVEIWDGNHATEIGRDSSEKRGTRLRNPQATTKHMIVWTGWGILAPFIIGGGIAAATVAANSVHGAGYAANNNWVTGAGIALGGFVCWVIGRWLYGRDRRVLVDKASGREFNAGASHTFFFIPMHWIGVVAILAAVPAGMYGIPESSRSKRRAQTGSQQDQPAPSFQYASASEAQQAAIRLHPELGVAGSNFNNLFRGLHKKYQQERPELFRDNNWPIIIADEVAKTLKPE